MRKADSEARLRVGRRVSVKTNPDLWSGEVAGTVIVKAPPPSTWWVLVDPDTDAAYRDKFVMARMDDMGNLAVYEPKKAKGK